MDKIIKKFFDTLVEKTVDACMIILIIKGRIKEKFEKRPDDKECKCGSCHPID